MGGGLGQPSLMSHGSFAGWDPQPLVHAAACGDSLPGPKFLCPACGGNSAPKSDIAVVSFRLTSVSPQGRWRYTCLHAPRGDRMPGARGSGTTACL